MIRVLVCGGRYFNQASLMDNHLTALNATHGPIACIIEGEAPGADTLAREWARKNLIPVEKYPANWIKYKKAAGPIRNKQMLDEGKPDVVVAFPSGPLSESRGTLNMVTQARKAGVRCIVVGQDDTITAGQ